MRFMATWLFERSAVVSSLLSGVGLVLGVALWVGSAASCGMPVAEWAGLGPAERCRPGCSYGLVGEAKRLVGEAHTGLLFALMFRSLLSIHSKRYFMT